MEGEWEARLAWMAAQLRQAGYRVTRAPGRHGAAFLPGLRRERIRVRISQRVLARRVNVTTRHLQNLERCRRRASLEVASTLMLVLGCSLDALTGSGLAGTGYPGAGEPGVQGPQSP